MSRTKIVERSGGRVKLQIKLDKDAAIGFKNFVKAVKPAEMTEEEFITIVFFNGVEYTNMKLEQQITKYMDEHPEELERLKGLMPEEAHDVSAD
jgi:hypothetical protein